MRLLSLACAAAIAFTTLVAAGPAKAAPFHLIRSSDTGFCQIWEEGIASVPWPGSYAVVSTTVPDFLAARDVKWHMLETGACSSRLARGLRRVVKP